MFIAQYGNRVYDDANSKYSYLFGHCQDTVFYLLFMFVYANVFPAKYGQKVFRIAFIYVIKWDNQ